MSAAAKRPRSISLVILLLIVLGIFQAAKVVALYQQSALLLELNSKPDPRVRMLFAAAWMILFWFSAAALWRRKAETRLMIPLVIATFFIYELAVLDIYAQIPISEESWIQHGIIALTLVLFVFWALYRSAARPYYLEDGPADG